MELSLTNGDGLLGGTSVRFGTTGLELTGDTLGGSTVFFQAAPGFSLFPVEVFNATLGTPLGTPFDTTFETGLEATLDTLGV